MEDFGFHPFEGRLARGDHTGPDWPFFLQMLPTVFLISGRCHLRQSTTSITEFRGVLTSVGNVARLLLVPGRAGLAGAGTQVVDEPIQHTPWHHLVSLEQLPNQPGVIRLWSFRRGCVFSVCEAPSARSYPEKCARYHMFFGARNRERRGLRSLEIGQEMLLAASWCVRG